MDTHSPEETMSEEAENKREELDGITWTKSKILRKGITMPKAYRWNGILNGERISGEAHSEEDVHIRARSMGCEDYTFEANPEAALIAEEAKVIEEVERIGDTALHLSEVNAALFAQVDAFKNRCMDLQTAIFQWNTEEEAASIEKGHFRAEPAWLQLVRELLG